MTRTFALRGENRLVKTGRTWDHGSLLTSIYDLLFYATKSTISSDSPAPSPSPYLIRIINRDSSMSASIAFHESELIFLEPIPQDSRFFLASASIDGTFAFHSIDFGEDEIVTTQTLVYKHPNSPITKFYWYSTSETQFVTISSNRVFLWNIDNVEQPDELLQLSEHSPLLPSIRTDITPIGSPTIFDAAFHPSEPHVHILTDAGVFSIDMKNLQEHKVVIEPHLFVRDVPTPHRLFTYQAIDGVHIFICDQRGTIVSFLIDTEEIDEQHKSIIHLNRKVNDISIHPHLGILLAAFDHSIGEIKIGEEDGEQLKFARRLKPTNKEPILRVTVMDDENETENENEIAYAVLHPNSLVVYDPSLSDDRSVSDSHAEEQEILEEEEEEEQKKEDDTDKPPSAPPPTQTSTPPPTTPPPTLPPPTRLVDKEEEQHDQTEEPQEEHDETQPPSETPPIATPSKAIAHSPVADRAPPDTFGNDDDLAEMSVTASPQSRSLNSPQPATPDDFSNVDEMRIPQASLTLLEGKLDSISESIQTIQTKVGGGTIAPRDLNVLIEKVIVPSITDTANTAIKLVGDSIDKDAKSSIEAHTAGIGRQTDELGKRLAEVAKRNDEQAEMFRKTVEKELQTQLQGTGSFSTRLTGQLTNTVKTSTEGALKQKIPVNLGTDLKKHQTSLDTVQAITIRTETKLKAIEDKLKGFDEALKASETGLIQSVTEQLKQMKLEQAEKNKELATLITNKSNPPLASLVESAVKKEVSLLRTELAKTLTTLTEQVNELTETIPKLPLMITAQLSSLQVMPSSSPKSASKTTKKRTKRLSSNVEPVGSSGTLPISVPPLPTANPQFGPVGPYPIQPQMWDAQARMSYQPHPVTSPYPPMQYSFNPYALPPQPYPSPSPMSIPMPTQIPPHMQPQMGMVMQTPNAYPPFAQSMTSESPYTSPLRPPIPNTSPQHMQQSYAVHERQSEDFNTQHSSSDEDGGSESS
ncbi:hypothetical protein BLNAU_11494 [Blattamonas nauphoetae]|uniref:Uncharacterized protein n=1 Tax=Blattamonas nauphoetae TaxID=2049346 RepID=A0ABQ9XP16_9EUKA|nr:hypothetical protein BLNAU_11494 [Blattamonas nauphoetae]